MGRDLNLNAEENFEEALRIGQEKDQELKTAKLKGEQDNLPPLFGIPFSVKD